MLNPLDARGNEDLACSKQALFTLLFCRCRVLAEWKRLCAVERQRVARQLGRIQDANAPLRRMKEVCKTITSVCISKSALSDVFTLPVRKYLLHGQTNF